MQMKMFDDAFHEGLNARVQPDQVKPSARPLSYGRAYSITAALQHRQAIINEMHPVQQRGSHEMNSEDDVGKAVLHNLQLENRCAVWIDLPDALQGPAHDAKMLMQKLQENVRSLASHTN